MLHAGSKEEWYQRLHRQRYWQLLGEWVELLGQIRTQANLTQARALAARAGLVQRFGELCQFHGLELGYAQQASLVAMNPMSLVSQFVHLPLNPYNAKPLDIMPLAQLDQHLAMLVTTFASDAQLVGWLDFRGALYTQCLLVAYEAADEGDGRAKLLNSRDLGVACPGYEQPQVRQQAKRQLITAASSALAGLCALPAATKPVKSPQPAGADLGKVVQHADYAGLYRLLLASQQPASFLMRYMRGGLAELLSLRFDWMKVNAEQRVDVGVAPAQTQTAG